MNPKAVTCVLFVGVLALCTLISLPLRAQVAGATLSGTITDTQGGAVPNAKVSVKNIATDVTVETTTNASGSYTVPNLIPAEYQVTISAAGFATTATKLTLTVGQKQELNLALTVGQVVQTVEVTGAAPQVELESSTIAGNVDATTVRELPLNGRDWTTLATLEPGVASVRTHLDLMHVGVGGRGFGMQLTIGGGRPTQNSYRLDGAILNDYSNAGPGNVLGQNLGVDAVQEFTVLTSNYSSEYGFTSGGVINAVTRSGTNTFHGTAFDFVRNDAFDANDFFANAGNLSKPPLRQNQFGASGGYKILKDRLFLFGDYEGVRQVKGITHAGDITISQAVRAGTVTNLATGAVTTVPIDPNIQRFLGLYPAATAGSAGCVPLSAGQSSAPGVVGGCNPDVAKFLWLGDQRVHENFFTFRSDYKISDKDSIFGTYLHDYSHLTAPQSLDVDLQSLDSWREAIVLEETHVFNAAWANSTRVASNRSISFGGDTPTAVNPLAADPTMAMLAGRFSPTITLTSSQATNLPAGILYGASVQHFWGQMFEFFDDAFVTRGNHGLKFGFDVLTQREDVYSPLAGGNGNGIFTFAGTYPNAASSQNTATVAEGPCYSGKGSVTSGNSYDNTCGTLVNFLTNQPRSAAPPTNLPEIVKHYLRDKIFGGYVQDDWRFRSNLTLNLGLRYEMSTIPTDAQGQIFNMPTLTTALPCSPPDTRATSVPLGGFCANPSDPTAPLQHVEFNKNPTLKNFEPRIGFAWDPFRNGKTAIRGGFGVFDALPLAYELILNSTQAAPYRSTLPVVGPGYNFSPPQGVWPFGIESISVSLPRATTTSRVWNYVEPNPKRNYVLQYNLNIQRQITPSTTVTLGYSGSRGIHNPFQADSANTVLPVDIGNPIPGVGYFWPGCFGPASETSVGQTACMNTLGTSNPADPTWSGNLTNAAAIARQINPTTAGLRNTMWQSRSWYNALQVRLDKRMSRGFQVTGSFTFSKTIDDSSGSSAGDNFLLDYTTEPWYDLSLNKGLAEFDVRRNLVINGLWNVPTPKSMGAIGDRVLGGWQLGLITELSDGVPSYPNIASDMLGEVIGTVNEPNLAPGCDSKSLINSNYRNGLFYVNAKCLTMVPLTATNAPYCDQRLGAGTCSNIRGNLGRNVIVGPGLFNMDFSVFKNNYVRRVSENFNVQFRAEMFNVLNHTNFAPSPNLAAFSATGAPQSLYGQLTSTQVPNRQVQLALKLVW